MLPPISPAVLDRNPRFAQLYKDLSTSRLNADASSRLIKQQRAQADIEKQLHPLRKDALQTQLLQESLSAVAHSLHELPPEVRFSCITVAGQLRGGLQPADEDLLRDILDGFYSNLRPITAGIVQQLKQLVTQLSTLLVAEEAREIKPSDLSNLATSTANLVAQNAATPLKIAQLRTRIVDLTGQINATHREILEASVRILEQTLHGSVARGMRAKAEHLAVVARGLDLKIGILDASDPLRAGSGEVREALVMYHEHLGDVKRKVVARVGEAEREVEGYEKEKGMGKIGKRYGEVLRKCEDVKAEIARLEGQQDPLTGVD